VQADHVIVRLVGDAGSEITASWPRATSGARVDPSDSDVQLPIADSSGHLATIILTLPPGRDIRPLEQRLLSDIAEQSALALRNVRLQVELSAHVRQLDRRARELTASRNRILGAVDTEKRRLESSIAVRVLPTMQRLRNEVARSGTGDVRTGTIGECVDLATEALESLRELTRGIYPTLLTRSGLGPALSSYAARMGRTDDVRIEPTVATARFPARVEAAAYFCCVEVLEHAACVITLARSDNGGELVVSLHGVTLEALNQLAIVDRVEACEGTLDVLGVDGGSGVQVRLPASA